MPNPLTNVTCADTYADAATLQNCWNSRGGWFIIATQAAYYQQQYGPQGEPHWTFEQLLPAGSAGSLDPHCTGVRFRNATAGQAAAVSAYIAQGQEPPISITIGTGSSPAIGYSVVGQGQVTGTNGTATVLGTLTCAAVTVRANPTNVGLVYLGKSTVTTANGYKMSPGDAEAFVVANTNLVYFDVGTTGDGVSWLAVG